MNGPDRISRRERWAGVDAAGYHAGTGSHADRVDAGLLSEALEGCEGLALDLPCGSGRLHDVIRARLPAFGADYSQRMLAHAVEHVGLRGVRVDAFRLGFRDDAFGAVVCLRLSFHYRDCGPLLRELARVTRPGGRIVLDSLNRFSLRWLLAGAWNLLRGRPGSGVVFRTPAEVEAAARAAGLRVTVHRARYLLPTRAYAVLPPALCALWDALERWVPRRFRVLSFWQLEKPVVAVDRP